MLDFDSPLGQIPQCCPRLLKEPLDPARLATYTAKYAQGFREQGMTPTSVLAEYATALLVTPLEMRGL